MRLELLDTGTDSVAVGVTVVATLLVVALVVAVGYLLVSFADARRYGNKLLVGYLALVLLLSTPLYLLACGDGLKTPILRDYVKHRLYGNS